MKPEVRAAIQQMMNLHATCGATPVDMCFVHLLCGLAMADKDCPLGVTREDFTKAAGVVWDKVRRALTVPEEKRE